MNRVVDAAHVGWDYLSRPSTRKIAEQRKREPTALLAAGIEVRRLQTNVGPSKANRSKNRVKTG